MILSRLRWRYNDVVNDFKLPCEASSVITFRYAFNCLCFRYSGISEYPQLFKFKSIFLLKAKKDKLNIMAKQKEFVASGEAKGKAKQLRLFAVLAWVIAIAGEVFAILKLISNETLVWLVVSIVVILSLSLVGSFLWKKANRLDPASEKDQVRFFIQNQLGAIMAVLAFLPLVIFIFLNKDLDGKTKGIAGAVGVVALLVAGIAGVDFNPPSIEKYTEEINAQTGYIKNLNDGVDYVYWTSQGNKYHLYDDCQHIRNRDQFGGTVAEAWEARKIGDNELCKTCQKRAEKNLNVSTDDFDDEPEYEEKVLEDLTLE